MKTTKTLLMGFIILSLLASVGCKDDNNITLEEVATDNPLQTELDQSVHNIFEPYIKDTRRPALSIAAIDGSNTKYYNYGETERGSGELPSSTSFYEIASITKTLTASVIAALLEAEEIPVNTPIYELLPGDYSHLNYEGHPITLMHLLNHTAGFKRLPSDILSKSTNEKPYENYRFEDMLSYLEDYSLTKKPGTSYEYSNFGYALLSYIVEYQTETTISDYIQALITNPLNMTSTNMELYALDEFQNEQIMKAHKTNGEPTDYWVWNDWRGMGGLYSNLEDMEKYMRAQFDSYNGEMAKAFRQARELTYDEDDAKLGWAWHLAKQPDNLYFHTGGSSGFTSMIMFDPAKEKGLIVLTNSFDEAIFVPCFEFIDAFINE
ncbi:MAG: hypothetical protein Tsb0034_09720 [Ekhidna sp.]